MTTARTRASRMLSLAMVAVAVPFLAGQGCPSPEAQLTVDAGPDLVVQSGSVVIQASVSGGSGIYTYSWLPSAGLDKTNVLQPVFTAGAPGTRTYTLSVTDSAGATGSDSVTITVPAAGDSDSDGADGADGAGTPGLLVADAGPDKSTSVGLPVQLQGSASGGSPPYTYFWAPSTGLSSATVAQPLYTPSVSGVVNYTLTVTDALGAIDTDMVTINISASASVSALRWGADYSAGGYQLLATFTREMDETQATNTANYLVNGTLNPISAALSEDHRTVTMVFNQRLSSFTRVDIGVGGGLRDSLGGAVQAMTDQAIGPNVNDAKNPTVISRTWGNSESSYKVHVEFSEAMEGASAENVHNYMLGGVKPTKASLDASGKLVTLTFENTVAGFRSSDLLTIDGDVRDINGRNNVSTDPAGIDLNPADAIGPSAPASTRVWGINQARYTLSVTFDEVVDKTSAEVPANYDLGGNIPTAAELDASGRTVVLAFENTATGGISLSDTLTVGPGVLDINGQPTASTDPTAVVADPVDRAGPMLSADNGRMWASNQTTYYVKLTFSEAMDRASATNTANYSLGANLGAKDISPSSAVLDSTGRIVTLGFPTTATGGLTCSDLLTVSANVKDINGQANISTLPAPISANPADTVGPVTLSRAWGPATSVYQVTVVFSEVMDRLTTTRLANYRLHGAGGTNPQAPSSVELDPTGRIATLTFGSTGGIAGGFNYDDVLEIMPAITDINGRGTTSITDDPLVAAIASNSADATGPGLVHATFFQSPPADPPPPPDIVVIYTYWVDVLFDEVLDKESAETAAYVLSGGAVITDVVLQPDSRTVRLFLDVSAPDTVVDGETLTVPDTIQDINRNASAGGSLIVRTQPVVDAGGWVLVRVGEAVTFPASVTGGLAPYTYSWTPAVATLFTPDVLQPDFVPAATGIYTFTLTVTDSEGRTASDTLNVYAFR